MIIFKKFRQKNIKFYLRPTVFCGNGFQVVFFKIPCKPQKMKSKISDPSSEDKIVKILKILYKQEAHFSLCAVLFWPLNLTKRIYFPNSQKLSRPNVRIKSGRSSSRSTDSYARFNGPPSIKLTNLYGVLDNSVHDVETETETEAESDFSRESRAPMSHQRKMQRSKSTSPNRHIANQLKQRQKVMFKNFRPEDVDWLQ